MSHTSAPAKAATDNMRRPWNSRTPFQTMPQAMKIKAAGTSGGKANIGCGTLHSAIEEAPIR